MNAASLILALNLIGNSELSVPNREERAPRLPSRIAPPKQEDETLGIQSISLESLTKAYQSKDSYGCKNG